MLTRETLDQMRGLAAYGGLVQADAQFLLDHAVEADKVIAELREALEFWPKTHSPFCGCGLCHRTQAALDAAGNIGKERTCG